MSVNRTLAIIEELAGRPLEVEYFEGEHGDVRNTSADTARARADLGFAPQTPVEKGLAAEFEWMRERQAARPVGVAA